MAVNEKTVFHEEIARKLKFFVYFAKSYHSLERENNENMNELIKQYFSKRYSLSGGYHRNR